MGPGARPAPSRWCRAPRRDRGSGPGTPPGHPSRSSYPPCHSAFWSMRSRRWMRLPHSAVLPQAAWQRGHIEPRFIGVSQTRLTRARDPLFYVRSVREATSQGLDLPESTPLSEARDSSCLRRAPLTVERSADPFRNPPTATPFLNAWQRPVAIPNGNPLSQGGGRAKPIPFPLT